MKARKHLHHNGRTYSVCAKSAPVEIKPSAVDDTKRADFIDRLWYGKLGHQKPDDKKAA